MLYVLSVLFILYLIGLSIYRLFLSPIASVPGPKLAALTQWYETYYDLFKSPKGQFLFHYRELHKKYGPIIRLSPTEVHIDDSQFFHVLYSQTRQWDKPDYLQHRFGSPHGIFVTPDHELHRQRRAALNPFFSKRKISEYSPALQAQMDRVCARLSTEYKNTDKVLRLDWMFASFAADAVIGYCFENQYHWIEGPDFRCGFVESINGLVDNVHLVSQFPWLARLLSAIPEELLAKVNPNMVAVKDFNNEVRRQIDIVLANPEYDGKDSKRKTVFKALLESNLPPQELSAVRLQHEGATLIGAGMETTKFALSVGGFHIINNPKVFKRLREELENAIPDPNQMPTLEQLEKLPYLDACMQESFRMSYGVSQRAHRVSDHITLQYGKYVIPPGTTISMDNYSVSHDENIFPDSYTFKPERWLNGATAPDGRPLTTYMVAFGRGTRQCLGIALALGETCIIMANLFRRFNFELYDTDRSAVDCVLDCFAPRPKPGTQGVRVLVR